MEGGLFVVPDFYRSIAAWSLPAIGIQPKAAAAAFATMFTSTSCGVPTENVILLRSATFKKTG